MIKFSELCNFQPKQQTALQTLFKKQCKYLLYGGAGGGGKSYFLRWSALALVLYYTKKYNMRGVQVGLFSEDYPTLKDRQIAKIKREFPPWLGELKDKRDEGYVYQVSENHGGGQILLRNLDDPSKYASTEFAAEFVEEITKNQKDKFDDLRFRLRYPGIDEVKFVAATNPGQIGHVWVRKLWVKPDLISPDHEQARFFYIPATVQDNKYIDEDYINTLMALPEKKRKMLLEGSWDTPEGQVFEEWDEKYHVIKRVRPGNNFSHILHMDWGYSDKSAFSCHVSAIIKQTTKDGQNFNRVVTYKEFYGNLKAPDDWAELIYNSCKGTNIVNAYGDPAMFNTQTDGSVSIAKLFEKKWNSLHGGHWVGLSKGNNNRVAGVATVHNWLKIAPDGMPYWMITENCKAMITTIPDLVYDENNVDDVDTDQVDHAFDDAKYGLSQVKFIEVKAGSLMGGVKQSLRMKYNNEGQQIAFSKEDLFEDYTEEKSWDEM